MGRASRPTSGRCGLDTLDLVAIPYFALTMLAEWRALGRRTTIPSGDPSGDPSGGPDDRGADSAEGPSGARPAPRVPVGFGRRDTLANLGVLVGSVAVHLALEGRRVRAERFLFRHRVSNVGRRRSKLLTALVVWDFLYYWEHRWMHRVRLLWAHHVTHHSSERYNLSTALRQPWSPFLVWWVFWPMPLLGYDSATIRRAAQLDLLYQYWVHTEAIDRLPSAAEAVLSTPSHHRVHHGANPQYLDRNFGGVLIVWDKLFGTFEPEVRRVRYGLTSNVGTFNPLRIGYGELAAMARDLVRAACWRDRWSFVFGRPGWRPAG